MKFSTKTRFFYAFFEKYVQFPDILCTNFPIALGECADLCGMKQGIALVRPFNNTTQRRNAIREAQLFNQIVNFTAMNDPQEYLQEHDDIYKVVINPQGEYSIRYARETLPLGWKEAGKEGYFEECQDYIVRVSLDQEPMG